MGAAFKKLNPRTLSKNPVMFVVATVSALTTVLFIRDLVTGGGSLGFSFQINLWLWFTRLFANFAEAVAEGRGKAQADSLRKARKDTMARRLKGAGKKSPLPCWKRAILSSAKRATSSRRRRRDRRHRLGR